MSSLFNRPTSSNHACAFTGARRGWVSALALLALAGGALAQAKPDPKAPAPSKPAAPATPAARGAVSSATTTGTPAASTANPAVTNLSRMQRKLTVEFKDQRLEDVIRFIQEYTQADLEPEWLEGNATAGLDKEKLITMKAQDMAALDVLERVLIKAQEDAFSENGWQMTDYGTIQIAPKAVLNRDKRLVIYDMHDLLMVVPRFTDVPAIDLQTVLGQGQGGTGQSPFTGGGSAPGQGVEGQKSPEERLRELQDIITSTVETSQWVDNGGEGGTIRAFNGTLIINAPDYMHRALNGYPYWPRATHKAVNGRRWVSLTADTGISDVDGFAQQPVTGVVGGGGGGAGGGRGGGGGGGGGGGTTAPGKPK